MTEELDETRWEERFAEWMSSGDTNPPDNVSVMGMVVFNLDTGEGATIFNKDFHEYLDQQDNPKIVDFVKASGGAVCIADMCRDASFDLEKMYHKICKWAFQ